MTKPIRKPTRKPTTPMPPGRPPDLIPDPDPAPHPPDPDPARSSTFTKTIVEMIPQIMRWVTDLEVPFTEVYDYTVAYRSTVSAERHLAYLRQLARDLEFAPVAGGFEFLSRAEFVQAVRARVSRTIIEETFGYLAMVESSRRCMGDLEVKWPRLEQIREPEIAELRPILG